MPLNQKLYSLIKQRFGDVAIANENQRTVGSYIKHPITDKLIYKVTSAGEEYRCSCCFCSDTRKRLYINHRYGVFDPVTKSSNWHLATCFNEDCLKAETARDRLRDRLFGHHNRGFVISDIKESTNVAQDERRIVLPGRIFPLDLLGDDHFANVYLRKRGYNPTELSHKYKVGFCVEAEDRFFMANQKIIIPLHFKGELKGWQARYPADLNWKLSKAPKYYSCPGMKKSQVLYNYDQAASCRFGIVCEGPSDVWKAGSAAVALFGKKASQKQVELIRNTWKKIIILLDPDAEEESIDLYNKLTTSHDPKNVLRITLPDDMDAGDCTHEYLQQYIAKSLLKEKGIYW